MSKYFKYITSVIIAVAILASCNKDNSDEPNAPCRRTILLYIVATNSLGSAGYENQNLSDIESAIKTNSMNGCRVVVYHTRARMEPTLFEIQKNGNSVERKTLKTYSSSLGISLTVERMREVFADMAKYAPAREYELILWSHATAWAATIKKSPKKTFGDDNSKEMPIPELAEAIPDGLFNTINFDACYMSTVEVAYEMRKDANYLIAAPTEVLGAGMPYSKVMPLYFANNLNPQEIAATVFNHYNAQTGNKRSCAIAVTKLSEMDALANACRAIHATALPDPDISIMQYYNRQSSPFMVDFMQYYRLISSDILTYNKMKDIYDKAVIYKNATPTYLTMVIEPDNFSGLSTYMLGTSVAENDEMYRTLAWYKDIIQ